MSVTLLQGDCLELLPTLEAGSVNTIITDLPYGTTACKWDEVIPFAPMWEQVKRVLKPRGAFVTTASQPFTSALVMSNPEWFRYELIWNKKLANGFLDANRKPMRLHENVLVFYEQQPTYNPQMIQGEPYKRTQQSTQQPQVWGKFTRMPSGSESGQRFPKSIIECANANQRAKIHPTQKPVALYEYLIRTYTNEGDTVLDFTMGSGTTGCAAVNTGRRFVGIEKDANYFAIAQRRIAEAQAQPALLEAAG